MQALARLRRAVLGSGNVAGGVLQPPQVVNSGTTKQPEKLESTANNNPIVPSQAPSASQNLGGKPPQSQPQQMMKNVPPMMQNGQHNGFGGAAPQFQYQNGNMMDLH